VQNTGARAPGESFLAVVKPSGQHGSGLLVNADRAALIALAVTHLQRPGLQVEVAQLE